METVNQWGLGLSRGPFVTADNGVPNHSPVFLTSACPHSKPSLWWFEIINMAKRLMLTCEWVLAGRGRRVRFALGSAPDPHTNTNHSQASSSCAIPSPKRW